MGKLGGISCSDPHHQSLPLSGKPPTASVEGISKLLNGKLPATFTIFSKSINLYRTLDLAYRVERSPRQANLGNNASPKVRGAFPCFETEDA